MRIKSNKTYVLYHNKRAFVRSVSIQFDRRFKNANNGFARIILQGIFVLTDANLSINRLKEWSGQTRHSQCKQKIFIFQI